MNSRNSKNSTPLTPAEQRQERLAAALRTNLRRRKEQARAKTDPAADKADDSRETLEVKDNS